MVTRWTTSASETARRDFFAAVDTALGRKLRRRIYDATRGGLYLRNPTLPQRHTTSPHVLLGTYSTKPWIVRIALREPASGRRGEFTCLPRELSPATPWLVNHVLEADDESLLAFAGFDAAICPVPIRTTGGFDPFHAWTKAAWRTGLAAGRDPRPAWMRQ